MEVGNVKTGDIIRCNVRGDQFWASVRSPVMYDSAIAKRVLEVRSLTGRPIPSRRVTPRQVIGHWRMTAKTADPMEGL